VNTDTSRATFERLLTEFGHAWESARPTGMAEVFGDEGAFVPSPFEFPSVAVPLSRRTGVTCQRPGGDNLPLRRSVCRGSVVRD